ncbi:hypothetical protein JZG80_07255 [Staphylococcus saprophyticus]|uniref:hypothetical protein n=1 Tax=Staphylococcus saprophyticus TaxID=29385 RepID=UPI001013C66F|nr:hypothetical protein [Staphylococcus saprophyticus]MBN6092370.1 hypothetical protein [Staphylococcus saprophyticus]MDW4312496.1 hypothetical protein [Staphylococcus saprophyticus]MDW4371585.1 hypothetical protein [Staphylococcus saprophyticus]RXS01977.1 hypothetical protein EUA49_10540 [Staphylococcus saprophyticus]
MNELINIKDDLNNGNLERKLQTVLNLVCDRITEDEEAEKIFEKGKDYFLANQSREFQDFNFIVSSTLKMLVDELECTIKEVNESIEIALSEQSANLPDNAQQ